MAALLARAADERLRARGRRGAEVAGRELLGPAAGAGEDAPIGVEGDV